MTKKGLPKSIIKKYGISKKAWRVFRGGKTSKSRTSKSKTKSKTKKVRKTTKKKRRGGKSLQTTVFKWLRIGALAAPAIVVATQPMKIDQKANEIFRLYSGVNIKHSMESNSLQWDGGRLAMGWLPYLTTVLATYGIPKIAGIIRRL
jgi:hypothetical protein